MKKLIFDKHTENLVEIAMAFAALVSKYTKLTDTDSVCLLYTSPSPRDLSTSRMPSSA